MKEIDRISSSADHASVAQRMLVKSACRKVQECIEMMPATGDPEKVERLTNAVMRLVTTINKLPVFKEVEEKEKSVERLVEEMGAGEDGEEGEEGGAAK